MAVQHNDSRLDRMFFPKSVAVVGASDVPAKWGNLILTSILGWKFGGRVFPVNPNKDTILGLKSYPSLRDIPEEVDLAVFTIPARFVPEGLRDCAAKGIKAAVIISSGFRETGSEGAGLEREIVAAAKEGGILFIGPNTMGIASAHHFFECLPSPTAPGPGGLAVVSQSGNIGLQIIKWIAHKQIGLAVYAGTGNESMLKAGDIMRYLGSLDEVKAIAMYIEGIDDGRTFGETAKEVTLKKPVIAIKTGRSQAGSKAAQSHTGSMAGSFATYSAMFRQSGVIQVTTPTDLINVSAAATHLPIPRSNRVGIMTMGGGWGIIAADECEDSGLVLPALPESMIRDLDPVLPEYWNRRNPIDVVGENDASLYLRVIGALARWSEVDSVIALGIVGRSRYVEDFISAQERLDGKLYSRELKLAILKDQVRTEERIISGVAALQKETGKPIIVVGLTEGGLRLADTSDGRVVCLSTPEEAVSIVAHLAWYGKYLKEAGVR
ncbi:MAG: succinyl-CoA synthetase subunit alpha [Deltaproteobacteria bacterium ADurb.BinA179]|jgi:acyl-CoA synthetase (NDP forming)|nr:MAG: succinyl-CoA synthetase subunit alpha [Deltaproteobacteria bacterium ADurb.BinA179]HOD69510.1 CoA-binding protein [Deltaproteobacteria bacterium]HQM19102.1 CoA-binding protein [Deltaproteobacteria bacterium]HRC96598.1 CoA-binding protein [Deltaproteobacteria bacterium]